MKIVLLVNLRLIPIELLTNTIGVKIMSTNYYLVPLIPTQELEVLNKYGFQVKKSMRP